MQGGVYAMQVCPSLSRPRRSPLNLLGTLSVPPRQPLLEPPPSPRQPWPLLCPLPCPDPYPAPCQLLKASNSANPHDDTPTKIEPLMRKWPPPRPLG